MRLDICTSVSMYSYSWKILGKTLRKYYHDHHHQLLIYPTLVYLFVCFNSFHFNGPLISIKICNIIMPNFFELLKEKLLFCKVLISFLMCQCSSLSLSLQISNLIHHMLQFNSQKCGVSCLCQFSNNENVILKIRLVHYTVNNDTLICAQRLTTELENSPAGDDLLVGSLSHG